eukprot:587000-Amphidinium_carterae.1
MWHGFRFREGSQGGQGGSAISADSSKQVSEGRAHRVAIYDDCHECAEKQEENDQDVGHYEQRPLNHATKLSDTTFNITLGEA